MEQKKMCSMFSVESKSQRIASWHARKGWKRIAHRGVFHAPRTMSGQPDPDTSYRDCAQIKLQVIKLQVSRKEKACPTASHVTTFVMHGIWLYLYPVTFTLIPSEWAVNSGAYMHCMVVTPLEKSPF